MKRSLFMAFVLISSISYAQDNHKTFTHTLQENIGIHYIDEIPSSANGEEYLPIRPGKGLLNLIPAYEIGYNNKWFAKVRFRNYYNHDGTGEGFVYDASFVWEKTREKRSSDLYSLILSYNILKPTSRHIIKVGLSLGYAINYYSQETLDVEPHSLLSQVKKGDYDIADGGFGYGLELGYRYKLNKHFAIGIEADLLHSTIPTMATSGSVVISYTF